MRADQVEAAWRLFMRVLDVWKASNPNDFPNYAGGALGTGRHAKTRRFSSRSRKFGNSERSSHGLHVHVRETDFVWAEERRSHMKTDNPCILTINGGSSSIRSAQYHTGDPLKRGLYGKVDRIGLPGTILTFHNPVQSLPESRSIDASDHRSAAAFLIDWLEEKIGFASVTAVGHRVVHGMNYSEPQRVTQELMDELHRISPYDPDHLPSEIELIEAFRQRHPKLSQVACFDTAFHRTMPRVARLSPVRAASMRWGYNATAFTACLTPTSWKSWTARPVRRPPMAA